MYRAGQDSETKGQRGYQEEQATISNAAPLPFPLEARLDATGETVTLLQTCDWKGHSPSNVGVDKNGKQFISSFGETTVTDHRVLPNERVNEIRGRAMESAGRVSR